MKRLLAVLLLILLSGTLFAAQSVYPGSRLVFDMNLTEKNFLPTVKKVLPAMIGFASAKIPGVPQAGENPAVSYDELAKEVVASLDGLKSVSVAYYELAGVDAAKITQFYAPKIGLTEGWNPVVRMESPKGSFRLYVKPELEEMFSLAVAPKGYVVVHTTGKIDATRLAELAAKAIPAIMSRQPAPKTEPAPPPASVEVPTPEPAPAPVQ